MPAAEILLDVRDLRKTYAASAARFAGSFNFLKFRPIRGTANKKAGGAGFQPRSKTVQNSGALAPEAIVRESTTRTPRLSEDVNGAPFALSGNSASAGRAAVDGVTFSLERGETLGIVGESGCGKTTLARLLLRLIEPDSGEILFRGENWLGARGSALRSLRRRMQMVFQDPVASLNPRMRVGSIVSEPLAIHEPRLSRADRRQRASEILAAVGLGSDALDRYPHEFSGGQRQRIGIARALILRPELVIADEPVSALDVSVGAQILDLLARLGRDFSLTLILISHSLPVVAQLASRVAVMQSGRFVEIGPAPQILTAPQHPYTQSLLAAVPEIPA